MKTVCFYLTLTLSLFISDVICAGESYTLNDCFKAALKRSEILANQQELVVQAEENYRRAWGSILPEINGSYSYLYRNAPGLIHSGNTAASAGQQTAKIMANQPLFRGFRDFAALNATKSFITEKEHAAKWAGLQLYRDVAQAFYTRLSVQKDLEIIDTELGLYHKRINELNKRVRIGRSRITEVLTVQSAEAILKAQREQIFGQLDVSKEVLTFLTGLDQDIQLAQIDAIPSDIQSLSSYQSHLNKRPDIIAARKTVEAYTSNVSVARGAHLPSVDLTGNYYIDRPDLRRNGDWDWQITVTLPIFAGGITHSNVKTAKSLKRQSENQLRMIERLAAEDIRSLYHNLKADLAQFAALQEAFILAEKNYKATVKDYEINLVTNLDVLQALAAYQDTQRSLETIRYRTLIDYHHLEAATARALPLLKGINIP